MLDQKDNEIYKEPYLNVKIKVECVVLHIKHYLLKVMNILIRNFSKVESNNF